MEANSLLEYWLTELEDIFIVLSATVNMSAVEIRKNYIRFRLRLLRPLVWQIGNELKLSIAVEESVGCLGYEINGISHVRKGSFKQKSLNGRQNYWGMNAITGKIVKICTFIQLKFAQFSILSALPFKISVSVAERKLVYWILRPRLLPLRVWQIGNELIEHGKKTVLVTNTPTTTTTTYCHKFCGFAKYTLQYRVSTSQVCHLSEMYTQTCNTRSGKIELFLLIFNIFESP